MKIYIFCLCVGQLVHLFTERWKCVIFWSVFKISLPKLVHTFLLTHLMSWFKFNFKFLFLCRSVGSFGHWNIEKWDILGKKVRKVSKFSSYLYQICWTSSQTYVTGWLNQNKIFLCVSVSWFICSVKDENEWYFGQFSIYLYQNW